MTDEHNTGNIFWPIKEGDLPNIDDAYKTLYELSSCDLYISPYAEDGNTRTKTLFVELEDIYGDYGKDYFRSPLKELLKKSLETYDYGDDNAEDGGYITRLLKNLIKVIEEAETE